MDNQQLRINKYYIIQKGEIIIDFIKWYPEPEKWVYITDSIIPNIIPNRYMVSTYGRIYNTATQNYLPKEIRYDLDRYVSVGLLLNDGTYKNESVHRIVMMAFHPIENYSEMEPNHINGNKTSNNIWNLEWLTHKENMEHAVNTGLYTFGEDRDNSLLTNEQVHQICKLIADGKSQDEIANIMNLQNCNVRKIVTNIKLGLSWKNISKDYDFSNAYKKSKFTDEDVHTICKYFQDHGRDTPTSEICKLVNIDYYNLSNIEKNRIIASISAIRKKKTFKNICNLYNY